MRRRVAAYQRAGIAGLVDGRLAGSRSVNVDPRWDRTLLSVLKSYTNASTPSMLAVIDETNRQVVAAYGTDVALPARASAYRRVAALSKGRHTFGSAKSRRSVAKRPQGVLGRLRADRPGEYVVLDTNSLDVFAMEPVTGRWVPVQLTVAMDLFSRCILGLRLTPVSTKAIDVANVLFQCVMPQSEASGSWPYPGVPTNVLVGTEEPDGVHQQRRGGLPAVIPDTIVTDHGKQYLSAHVIGACARMGICVQPAIKDKPTDKPTLERFFGTLRLSLLQHLTGYKGPDVYSRGADVEQGAFYYVAELEQVIREWVTTDRVHDARRRWGRRLGRGSHARLGWCRLLDRLLRQPPLINRRRRRAGRGRCPGPDGRTGQSRVPTSAFHRTAGPMTALSWGHRKQSPSKDAATPCSTHHLGSVGRVAGPFASRLDAM